MDDESIYNLDGFDGVSSIDRSIVTDIMDGRMSSFCCIIIFSFHRHLKS